MSNYDNMNIVRLTFCTPVSWEDCMIHFVVCDDESFFRQRIIKTIQKIKSKRSIECEIHEFKGYNSEFEAFIRSEISSKIYILDIEMKTGASGIDIARKIRKSDWDSIIMFVTSHTELGYDALKANIMLLDFISKYDECESNLEKVLLKAIQKVNQKKIFSYDSAGISHRIYLDDILYITRDSVDRKCVIRTTYSEVVINKSLTEMIRELDERFFCSHRSCLVNTEKITSVDWKEGIITFDTGESTYLLARDKKKGLKEYVSSVD